MMMPFHVALSLPPLCQSAAQVGLSVLIRSTLLLWLGLLLGRALRRFGPAAEALAYRAALAAVVVVGVLSVTFAGSLKSLWSVGLPPAQAVAHARSMPPVRRDARGVAD